MFQLKQVIHWAHHRGGWNDCVQAMKSISGNGPLLFDCVDEIIRTNQIINEPWYGFIHSVIRNPAIVTSFYGENTIDIKKILPSETWRINLPKCKGIFTLSKITAEYLRQHVDVPVHSLIYPATSAITYSGKNPDVYMVGHWLRNFQAFYNLEVPCKKYLICGGGGINYHAIGGHDSVERIGRLSEEEYDQILSKNIVFLNLYDCAAVTTVVECIVRNTPILINRLPALEEYLGVDYPFFYKKLSIITLEGVGAAHQYLKDMNKEQFSMDYFLRSLSAHICK